MKMCLRIEHEGAVVEITPSGGESFDPLAGGDGRERVAIDWQRWARVAACTVSCLASTAREHANATAADQGGAHQSPPTDPAANQKHRPGR